MSEPCQKRSFDGELWMYAILIPLAVIALVAAFIIEFGGS